MLVDVNVNEEQFRKGDGGELRSFNEVRGFNLFLSEFFNYINI